MSCRAVAHPGQDGVVIVNGTDPATSGGQYTVDHEVTVVPPEPPTTPTAPSGPLSPQFPTPLPDTGVRVGEYLRWAFGLIAAGTLVLLAVRRRGARR